MLSVKQLLPPHPPNPLERKKGGKARETYKFNSKIALLITLIILLVSIIREIK